MDTGTSIPQYVTPVFGVVVAVVFCTLSASNCGVEDDRSKPEPYATELVANSCLKSGMVEDAELTQGLPTEKFVHIASPSIF